MAHLVIALKEDIGDILRLPLPHGESSYLPCDGQILDRAEFPELCEILGRSWKAQYGDSVGEPGDKIALPSLPGWFIKWQ